MGLIKLVGISYQKVCGESLAKNEITVSILGQKFTFDRDLVNVYTKENFIQMPVDLAIEKGLLD